MLYLDRVGVAPQLAAVERTVGWNLQSGLWIPTADLTRLNTVLRTEATSMFCQMLSIVSHTENATVKL